MNAPSADFTSLGGVELSYRFLKTTMGTAYLDYRPGSSQGNFGII